MALTNKRADLVSAKNVKPVGQDQDLEVERAPDFQEREWRAQRIGWALGALLVDESDILEAAREAHGLKSKDEVDYAVIERGGAVSVVPT